MSEFTREPCRTNIVPLGRMSPEMELRLKLEQKIREQKLYEFNQEERRITNRVRRVATGVWEATKDTARVAWQWWGW